MSDDRTPAVVRNKGLSSNDCAGLHIKMRNGEAFIVFILNSGASTKYNTALFQRTFMSCTTKQPEKCRQCCDIELE
jgi:hypothetical protein